MKITLYKECCLNNKYQLVLAQGLKNQLDENSSPFLLYLNGLNKVEIDVDYTYMENSGTLIFDYSLLNKYSDIYNYNYMKVEFTFTDNITKIIRYCFVDDIRIRNEVVYLKYSEDYWHSYSNKIKGFNPSWLVSSRLITEYSNDNLFRLPYGMLKVPYDSFDGVYINPVPGINLLEDTFTIIMELQCYDIVSTTKTSDRDFNYLVLKDANAHDLLFSDFSILKDILKGMTNEYRYRINVGTPGSPDYKYYFYEIGNIYIFPKSFNLSNAADFNGWIVKKHGTGQTSADDVIKGYMYEYNINTIRNMATITIPVDFLSENLGTFKTKLEVRYNKIESSFDAHIKFMGNKYGISVMLEFQGQLADITDDFLLNYPVDYMGAAEYKQQVISSRIAQLNAGMNIFTQLMGFNASFANALNTNVKAITGGLGGLTSGEGGESGAGDAAIYAYVAKLAAQGNATAVNHMYEVQKGSEQIGKDVTLICKLNANAYGTNKGILNTNNSNIVNILNGLMIFSKVPNYRYVVHAVINNYGYATEFLVQNSNYQNLHIQDAKFFQEKTVPINYNYIQFYDCSVYGDFTNKIANKLNEILNKGIKIYYNENLTEDNLVVG